MRSGDLDTLIRVFKPAALQRAGRSRVASGETLVAECMAAYLPAVGSERFASDQAVANAPAVFIIRRELDVEAMDATHVIALVEDGEVRDRFAVKSVRPWPKDPRFALEVAAVAESVT